MKTQIKNTQQFHKIVDNKLAYGEFNYRGRDIYIKMPTNNKISRTAQVYRIRRQLGLCIKCGQPSDKSRCDKCKQLEKKFVD